MSLYEFPEDSNDEPHTIRLRGPWEFGDSSGRGNRITMPATWADIAAAGIDRLTSLRRRFNCPTGLETTQPVDLVIANVQVAGRVFLNDTLLGELKELRFTIAEHLERTNLLVIEAEFQQDGEEDNGAPIGEVSLEIFEQ